MSRSLAVAFGFVLAVLPAACADSTSIGHVWRAPDWNGSFTHVVVFGISEQAGVRRDFETKMAAALARAGVIATPAFELFPDTELSNEEIARVLVDEGIDGALVTRLVAVDRYRKYVGGTQMTAPASDFYAYYHYGYDALYTRGYTTEYEVVTLETNLYAVPSATLVWAGLSETFAPSSVEETIDSYAKTMVSALVSAGLIASTSAPVAKTSTD